MTTPIRVVPMRGPTGLIGAPQVKPPSTASFTYRGGPLLTAVEIVTVFWGAAWAEATAQATGTSVTDNAVQQMLQGEVARKSLPAPTANTLYFTFLPPGVTVVAGSDRSCQAFCGYHDRSAGGLYYAVVPYPDCSGCLGTLQPLDALTSVCSHELGEAITDA